MDDGVDCPTMAEQIAAAVRRLRKARRWTQQKLADEIGVHRSTVHLVEKGDRDHDHGTIQKIADALGVPIGDLTGAQGETMALSQEARDFALLYQSLDVEERATVMKFVRAIAPKSPSSQ